MFISALRYVFVGECLIVLEVLAVDECQVFGRYKLVVCILCHHDVSSLVGYILVQSTALVAAAHVVDMLVGVMFRTCQGGRGYVNQFILR